MPEAVRTNHAKMAELMEEYTIELYELATEEKLKARNFLSASWSSDEDSGG